MNGQKAKRRKGFNFRKVERIQERKTVMGTSSEQRVLGKIKIVSVNGSENEGFEPSSACFWECGQENISGLRFQLSSDHLPSKSQLLKGKYISQKPWY